MWASMNHIALVVADVGRSLQFYADVVGMKQIGRPNFDRQV
jgi:catechol 2,3-dioxygenase-like lactoylglutathione lyase family enzyme